jgi:hypothetical protein
MIDLKSLLSRAVSALAFAAGAAPAVAAGPVPFEARVAGGVVAGLVLVRAVGRTARARRAHAVVVPALSPAGSSRRRLLGVGLAGVAGAVGMAGTAVAKPWAGTAAPEDELPTNLRLYGSDLRSPADGDSPFRGTHGRLVNEPQGAPMGEFFSTSLQTMAPFGPEREDTASVELHTFRLSDGVIFGMGSRTGPLEASNVYAIVGGTERYALTRGSYIASQNSMDRGGDGLAVFDMTFTR